MKSKYGVHVLMLCYVDGNWMDIGGNTLPTEGFVESNSFEKDADIMTGLNGIMWGQTSYLPYEKIKKGNWLVVKTEINEDMIKTDFMHNRYKFPSGSVVFSGNFKNAAKYIIQNKDKDEFDESGQWVQPEEIAGSSQWIKEHGLYQRY